MAHCAISCQVGLDNYLVSAALFIYRIDSNSAKFIMFEWNDYIISTSRIQILTQTRQSQDIKREL
jgi:hypothetical protein